MITFIQGVDVMYMRENGMLQFHCVNSTFIPDTLESSSYNEDDSSSELFAEVTVQVALPKSGLNFSNLFANSIQNLLSALKLTNNSTARAPVIMIDDLTSLGVAMECGPENCDGIQIIQELHNLLGAHQVMIRTVYRLSMK